MLRSPSPASSVPELLTAHERRLRSPCSTTTEQCEPLTPLHTPFALPKEFVYRRPRLRKPWTVAGARLKSPPPPRAKTPTNPPPVPAIPTTPPVSGSSVHNHSTSSSLRIRHAAHLPSSVSVGDYNGFHMAFFRGEGSLEGQSHSAPVSVSSPTSDTPNSDNRDKLFPFPGMRTLQRERWIASEQIRAVPSRIPANGFDHIDAFRVEHAEALQGAPSLIFNPTPRQHAMVRDELTPDALTNVALTSSRRPVGTWLRALLMNRNADSFLNSKRDTSLTDSSKNRRKKADVPKPRRLSAIDRTKKTLAPKLATAVVQDTAPNSRSTTSALLSPPEPAVSAKAEAGGASHNPMPFYERWFPPRNVPGARSMLLPREPVVMNQTLDLAQDVPAVYLSQEEEEAPLILPSVAKISVVKMAKAPAYSGGYADVWHGRRIPDGSEVALKALRMIRQDRVLLKRISREISIWSNLDHVNILPLLGIAPQEGSKFPYLVSPWMKFGNVKKYLEHHPDESRTEIILGIRDGLAYLHEKGIVHGDIKASNILVDDDGRPQLADFGLSVLKEDDKLGQSTTSTSAGSLRWMAPERFIPRQYQLTARTARSPASDVFSFGMTIYEVFSGLLPFHEETSHAAIVAIISGVRPPHPGPLAAERGLSPFLWDFAQWCWDAKPASRPKLSFLDTALAMMQ